MNNENKITVYADLNCPYCYALNERLLSLNAAQSVVWKPVEHAPDLHAHSFTEKDRQELVAEVEDVKTKAADVTLHLPNLRPNSRLSSELLATVIRSYPDKAVSFRTAVYRALWQRSEDISDPEILEQLLISCGLPGLQVAFSASDDLAEWHGEWEFGQFARNIPGLESNIGYKMLGFPPVEQLKAFLLEGKSEITSFNDAACVASARYSIAVISDKQSVWRKPKLIEAISRLNYFASVDELINSPLVRSSLDLIVLDGLKQETLSIIRSLKNTTVTQYIPIVLLFNEANDNMKIDAYRAGVADVVSCDENEEILGHRIVRLLHAKRYDDKLYEITNVDALTNLYNRRKFDETLNSEWKRKSRDQIPLSLLMIDVDEFKFFNDSYGHSLGDDALRRLAGIIKSCVHRPADLVVRYGEDEFVVLLVDTDIEDAKLIAELIRAQVAVHDIKYSASHVKPYLTVSIGVAEINKSMDISKDEFISLADKALYKAKQAGRDRIVVKNTGGD